MAELNNKASWTAERLRPEETVMAGMAAVLWIAVIGSFIASAQMVKLVSAAFRIQPPAITSLVNAIGAFTGKYWLLSLPIWSAAFLASLLWSLATPDRRLFRLSGLIFMLAVCLGVVLIAVYIPMAQAAHSIAMPPIPGNIAPR
jgi:hypothetical protein